MVIFSIPSGGLCELEKDHQSNQHQTPYFYLINKLIVSGVLFPDTHITSNCKEIS